MSELDIEITDHGDTMTVFEIMQRYRSDGSCEDLVRNALVAYASAPPVVEKIKCLRCEHGDGVYGNGICKYVAAPGELPCICPCVFPAATQKSLGDKIEGAIKQWRGTIIDGTVSDEDAEDLMFRVLAIVGAPVGGDEVQNKSGHAEQNLSVPSTESKATPTLDAAQRKERILARAELDEVIYLAGYKHGIASERERCANIAEGLQHAYAVDVALKIAAAIRNSITQAGGGPQITTAPDHGPASKPERCPKCGRKANSDFDQDVGGWFECDECNYQWSYQAASTERLPDDLTVLPTEKLNELIDAHQSELLRLKYERAKVWRFRVATGNVTDEDRECLARVRADLAGNQRLRHALQAFVDYYEQAGIGECTEGHDDDNNEQFSGDERFNVRQGRKALAGDQGEGTAVGSLACTECPYIFTATEFATEDKTAWGHPCHGVKDEIGTVCESFRERLGHLAIAALNERDSLVKELNDVKVAEIHAAQRCLAAESQRDLLREQLAEDNAEKDTRIPRSLF